MRKDLVDILACPVCKSKLTLTVEQEKPLSSGAGQEVIAGALHCAKCNEAYPIKDGIPNLLPPQMREKVK